MQKIIIWIALMLCLMERAFAYNIPIQKEIGGQEDEGKNIIANVPVGNRKTTCIGERQQCVRDDPSSSCCKGLACEKKLYDKENPNFWWCRKPYYVCRTWNKYCVMDDRNTEPGPEKCCEGLRCEKHRCKDPKYEPVAKPIFSGSPTFGK